MFKLMGALFLAFALNACTTFGPYTATSNPVGNKKGQACYSSIFGIPLGGLDVSIYKAAKNGGIKKISTVDTETFFALIYNKRCTIVRGR